MCIALVIESGAKPPSFAALEAMERANPDGAGVGWHAKGRNHYWRGLSALEVCELLDAIGNDCTRLVHFRWATVGEPGHPGLCHPFVMEDVPTLSDAGDTDRPIMIHNGHWHGYDKCTPSSWDKGDVSDTRVMARIGHAYPSANLANLGGKVAVMQPTGDVEIQGDGWTHEDGIWYSNKYWKWSQSRKRGTSTVLGYPSALPSYESGSFDEWARGKYGDDYGDTWPGMWSRS